MAGELQVDRRSLIRAALFVAAAPAIVRIASLMPVRALPIRALPWPQLALQFSPRAELWPGLRSFWDGAFDDETPLPSMWVSSGR